MEIKTGGRENGQRIYSAYKIIEYLETLKIGKMYGIQRCNKGITVLTKNEVISKDFISTKFDEKIVELNNIANSSKDIIEKEIAKGMGVFVLMLKKELLEEDKKDE